MQYIIIQQSSLNNLANEVNQQIEKGYKPLGGIAVDTYHNYIQAMVKRG
ncbi:MAG TPA: hypothetical protein PLU21_00995 [Candidatus Saccharibacteria bacterium]|nr:hypothetical protein [Candidatus Saccharibacteria bacterium]